MQHNSYYIIILYSYMLQSRRFANKNSEDFLYAELQFDVQESCYKQNIMRGFLVGVNEKIYNSQRTHDNLQSCLLSIFFDGALVKMVWFLTGGVFLFILRISHISYIGNKSRQCSRRVFFLQGFNRFKLHICFPFALFSGLQ